LGCFFGGFPPDFFSFVSSSSFRDRYSWGSLFSLRASFYHPWPLPIGFFVSSPGFLRSEGSPSMPHVGSRRSSGLSPQPFSPALLSRPVRWAADFFSPIRRLVSGGRPAPLVVLLFPAANFRYPFEPHVSFFAAKVRSFPCDKGILHFGPRIPPFQRRLGSPRDGLIELVVFTPFSLLAQFLRRIRLNHPAPWGWVFPHCRSFFSF